MRPVIILCIVLTLPFLAAVSHDLYIAYDQGTLLSGQPIKLSDIGWIWTQYHPESYILARENIGRITWDALISPILRERSILVTAVPPGVLFAYLIAARILGIWPFTGKGLGGVLFKKRKKKGGRGFKK